NLDTNYFNGLASDYDDYYKFTLAENSTVNLKLNGLSQDFRLSLYDSQGQSNNIGNILGNGTENITGNLRAGTYYVSIYGGYGAGNGTNYQFEASAVSLGNIPVGDNPINATSDLGTLGAVVKTVDLQVQVNNPEPNYYKFTLGENSTVNLQVSGSSQYTSLSLLYSNGNQIFNSVNLGNIEENISKNLRAGIYYLQVYGGGSDTTYKLDASAVSLGAFPADNAGQHIDTAKDIGVLKSEVTSSTDFIGHFNGLAYDLDDYYKFTLAENSTVNLNLSGLSQDANLYLYLRSSNGNVIQQSTLPNNVDENISQNLKAGSYYLQVRDGGSVNGTNYKLDASAISLGAFPVDNAGQTIDNAKDLGVLKSEVTSSTDFIGSFNGLASDFDDYYKFTLAENSTVNLKLSGLSQDANLDLYLRSSNGNRIQQSTLPNNVDENISQNLKAGSYYLQVRDGGSVKGTYYKLDASAISLGAFPVDNAGQNIDTAKDLGILKPEIISSTDFLGEFNGLASDYEDYYKFTLTENSTVNFNLSGLSQDANLSLLSRNGNLINNSIKAGNADENISQNLKADTYYLRISDASGSIIGTNYKLDASSTPLGGIPIDTAGDSFDSARDLGEITNPQQISEYIGNFNNLSNDFDDYYKFRVTSSSFVKFDFTGTSRNINASFLNASRSGFPLAVTTSNTLSQGLSEGTYFLRVSPTEGIGTKYQLNVSAPAIADFAGHDTQTARDIGVLNTARSFTDFVGQIDYGDFYRFELKEASTFNLNFNPERSINTTILHFANSQGQWLNTVDQETNQFTQELDAGVYYAQVYNFGGTNSDTYYNLSLSAIPKQDSGFQILGVNPIGGSNKGEATINIKGNKFTRNAQVSIIDPAGKVVSSSAVTVLNDSNITAKFDLKGQVTGAYDVQVVDQASQALVNDVFLVNDLQLGRLQVDIAATAIRPGGTGQAIVTYRNAGNTDIPAPFLTLVAPNGLLEESGEYKNNKIQFLAINKEGNAGVLPAGASGSFRVNFRDMGGVSLEVNSLALDENVDWNGIKDSSRPEGIAADVWDKIYSNFVTSVGGKASEFQKVLNENATRLSQLGEYTGDISRLLSFELQQVNSNAISARSTVGTFGRGGVNPWDVTAITDAAGDVAIQTGDRRRTFTKGKDGKYQGITDDLGILTKVGDVYQIKEFDGTVQSFLANGKLDFIQDTNGNKVTLGYTANLLTGLSYSNGDKVTFKYNAQGRVNEVVDIYGQSTTYTYDATGERLLSVSDVSGAVSYTYETEGAKANAIKSITYPDGTQSLFEYDDLGRVTKESLNGGERTLKYSYDSTGGVTVTDANNKSTQVLLNDRGQVAQTTDALGRVSRFSYDSKGNLTQVLAPDSSNAKFTYDSKGNLLASTDALGQSVQFAYDSRYDQIKSVTDQKGNAINYTYDDKGNLGSIGYADGSKESFTYNDKGDVTVSSNRRGQQISYTYDSRGLLTKKAFADGTAAAFEYDVRGNLTKATDADSSVTYSYDAADRLTNVSYGGTRSLSFSYDAGGRRSKMVDQDGFATNYSYDSVGRLKQLTDKDAKSIVSYSYNTLGQLSREDNGNGTHTTYSYDDAGQALSIVNYKPDNSINSRNDYTYNQLGQRTSMTTLEGKTSYGYDLTGQLTSVALASGRSIEYKYDAAGNRITVKDSGATTDYSTNNLNQYTTVGGNAYTYDKDGNLVSKTVSGKTSSFSYDIENRLIGVTNADGTWQYQYDALGNRIGSTFNGQKTDYLLDPTGLGDVVGEYTSSQATRYSHGLGLVSRNDGTNTSFFDTDAIGSVVGLSGTGGNYLNSYSYLPFGESLTKTETVANSFEYVGQYGVMNEANGLEFMRARFYTSGEGRFLNPDPIGVNGGLNLYKYVKNYPTGFIDITGKDPIPPASGRYGSLYPYNGNPYNGSGNPVNGTGTYKYANLSPSTSTTPSTNPFKNSFNYQDWRAAATAEAEAAAIAEAEAVAIAEAAAAEAAGAAAAEAAGAGAAAAGAEAAGAGAAAAGAGAAAAGAAAILGGFAIGTLIRDKFFPDFPGFLSYLQVPILNSFDPNDIIGPGGTGTDRWLTPDPILPYTIRFENVATATAPAVLVNITHTLDSDLDLNTFELGDFGFGSTTITIPDGLQNYTTRLDLRDTIGDFVDFTATLNTTTRLVTWKIITIDPLTGEPAEGVTDGFLPPNNANRDGEGFVNYRVKSKSDTPNGASLDAQASIVFDTNAAIETPVWSNKIDTNAPTSQVTALSANSSPNFNVAWTGADNGSGVAKYDIYVSDNGGNFTIWKQGITDTSATYTGELNHVYRFYSVATDGVGFQESAPNQADTSTTVVLINNPPTVANLIADQTTKQGDAFNFQIPTNSFTDIDAGDILTYAATLENGNVLPTWLSFNATTLTLSGIPTNDNVGNLNVKVTATDKAGGNISDIFAIAVENLNDAPIVSNAIADQNAKQGNAFNFQIPTNTFTDIDAGDVLTYSATLENGNALPSWLIFNPTTRTFSGTPINDNVGSLNVKVAATDKAGASVNDIFVIAVENVNDAPVLSNAIANQNAKQGDAFNFQIPPNTFTDIDAGDVLTYSATLENGNALPSWLTFNSTTRTFSGTPTNDNVGSLNVKVAATDKAGASVNDIFVIAVENLNDAPIVNNAIADQNAKQGNAFNFQIPTNTFTDIDAGDVLTYSATLENGNALPSWITFNPTTRTFSGTPTNDNVGTLNVKVSAIDKAGVSVNDIFAIAVENLNDAPIVNNAIADVTATENTAFSFTIPENTFTDIDAGDSLTYSATLKDGSNLPSWLKFNPATRTFNGTLTNANIGSLTIQVRAKDNDGLIATDTFLLAVKQSNTSPTLKLSKIADDIFNVFDSSGKSKLQVTLTERSSNLVNELGIFTVDDAQGKINGIAPGSSSYAQAALDRAKVIFSAIANLPNGFNTNNLTHLLEFNSGENLRFYLVRNSTIDAVRAGVTPLTDILFSDPLKQKITDLGSDEFSIAWKDKDGNSTTDFKDLVVKIQSTNDSLPLGTNLQGKPQGEVIDLRGVTSQVKADFIVNREAAFNNFIGFYQVADENGGIDTNSDGKADIFAGQAGYIEAAIRGRVAGIDLTVNNQGTATYTGTFQPGTIFAPFIIVDGRPEALLDSNPNNNPAVYFPFLGANADKVDHIRLLGNNVFGFEDLPNGGDKDFNDVIVRVNVSIV
ncbi:MAG: putative Ig domain-containing protein, partial [Aphanizomenon gracile PMC638.10]|nr:putative Ig domain-containing protein [Aphanizomenon gracile PMC638.10]